MKVDWPDERLITISKLIILIGIDATTSHQWTKFSASQVDHHWCEPERFHKWHSSFHPREHAATSIPPVSVPTPIHNKKG
jgi:hypothetical protein